MTSRNTRVGPVQLAPAGSQPAPIPLDTFVSEEDLLAFLLRQRQGSSVQLQGSLALPATMNPLSVPANSAQAGWATLTNITGLTAGVTRLGDELSLLYSAESIAGSAFASVVDWVWNGMAFDGSCGPAGRCRSPCHASFPCPRPG